MNRKPVMALTGRGMSGLRRLRGWKLKSKEILPGPGYEYWLAVNAAW